MKKMLSITSFALVLSMFFSLFCATSLAYSKTEEEQIFMKPMFLREANIFVQHYRPSSFLRSMTGVMIPRSFTLATS